MAWAIRGAEGVVSAYLCSDEEADHAFVRDVMLRAADLDPFLRRTCGLKLEALAR